jgi:tetratricopeptide (TPR) repeat protein
MVRFLFASVLAVFAASSALSGQANPRAMFTDALAQFSLALDGSHGDEGDTISASLDTLDRARRQWDGAIQTYESRMAAEIGGAPAELAARMHIAMGGAYLERNRLQDALREFTEALRLDPRRPEVHAIQGLLDSQVPGRARAAGSALQAAAALAPGDPTHAYLLARHLADVGPADAAATAFEQFLQVARAAPAGAGALQPFTNLGLVAEVPAIEPFFPPAAYAEGFGLLQEGRYEEATMALRAAAALDPLARFVAIDSALARQASSSLRSGATAQAVDAFAAIVRLAPSSGEAHRLLGLAYAAHERLDTAVRELSTAVSLSPADERTHLALAGVLFEQGRFPDAARALRDTLAAIPGSGRAHYTLGLVYQHQGDYPAAARELEQAAALKPLLGLNSIYQTLGALRRAQQDYDGAIRAFSARIAVVPNDPQAHQELGDMYFRQSRHPEALAEFMVASVLDPAQPHPFVAIGQIELREGRFDAAVGAATRAVSLAPPDKEARYVLATALLRLGRTEEGARELETFQRLQADATAAKSREFELGALRRDATVSTTAGDHEKAVTLLRRVLELDPGTAAAHLDLGVALLEAGHAQDAIEPLTAAIERHGPIDAHRHLAEAYAAAGRAEESQRERALYARLRQEALQRAGTSR